jgi:uncharacterized protein YecE (DUF72 family)
VNHSALFCGPSNFFHPLWEKRIHPGPKNRGFHPLELLAGRFDAVEITSSFDEFLKPELTRLWARKTDCNARFQFTVKVHRSFTHDRNVDPEQINAFKDGIRPLARASKLGCLLLQFPWSFRYTAENRKHFIKLRRAFHEFPLVAEMRHSSWMLDEAIGTFIDYRVGFCNIDQPVYTKAMPPTAFLTSSVGYVRLHGRNCFNWFGAADHPSRAPRYDYEYSTEELSEWARRVDQIRGYAAKTFVVTNNGTDGKAIAAASQLQQILDGRLPNPARKQAAQAPLFTEYHRRAVA